MLVQVLVLKVSGFRAKAVKKTGIPGGFAAKPRVYHTLVNLAFWGPKTGVETGKQVLVQACLNSSQLLETGVSTGEQFL